MPTSRPEKENSMAEQESVEGQPGAEVALDDAEQDKLWGQVAKERAGEVAQATPASPATPVIPESTQKLLDEIDRLKEAVTKQGSEIQTVGKHISTINGVFGNMKQQVAKIAPTVEAVEAERLAVKQAVLDAANAKRAELRERVSEIPDLVEYIDSVMPAKPEDTKPADKSSDDADIEQLKMDKEIAILQGQLSDVVPGWRTIRKEPEFQKFLETNPTLKKIALESLDVTESAGVFQTYKEQKDAAAKVAQVEKDRQERLRRGETPQGRGTTNASNGDDGDAWERVKKDREWERQGARA
jgi:hypothetical protein